MSELGCIALGCDRKARPLGLFCSDACRARAWKLNHPGYQSPPSQSARQNAVERRSSTSGLQLPYRKALDIVTAELSMFVEPERVEAALRKALPEKQRERLESRA